MQSYDIYALVRALLVSIGGGLIVGALGYFAQRDSKDWIRKRQVLLLALAGGIILSTVAVSTLWPYLLVVPQLDSLSSARAEETLTRIGLLHDKRPQYFEGVEVGLVIPKSQNPLAGQEVRPGTVVSFAVAVGGPRQVVPPAPSGQVPTVSIFQPESRKSAKGSRRQDGAAILNIVGTSSGLNSEAFQLLLWLKPVNPPSDVSGWYLQRPPDNGVTGQARDGRWQGLVQIGSARWPPGEGAVVDIAVTATDRQTAARLLAEQGVVVLPEPVGAALATSSSISLTLK